MKLNLALLITLFFAFFDTHAQSVGINTDGSSPDASALLDIKSTNKGMLIPRMSMVQRNAITTPATGLMIYQTDNTPGLYMYDGTYWSNLTRAEQVWSTTGNSGTDPNSQFFGTTDNQPLRLRLNNKWAGELNHITGNAMMGDSAGIAVISAQDNTGFGNKTFSHLTYGLRNTAVGTGAMSSATNCTNNTAIGYHSLYLNTSGSENIAIGPWTLEKNTTGELNVAIGTDALKSSLTASYNTAIGKKALYNNLSGQSNIAIGVNALESNTTGFSNVVIGVSSSFNNTSGASNVAIGYNSFNGNITGNNNVAIGSGSGTHYNGFYNNTVSIGNFGWLNGADNQVFLGNQSMSWIGGWQPWSVFSDARIKTDIREDVKGIEFIKRLRPVTYHRDIDLSIQLTGNQPTEDFPHKYDAEQIKYSGFIAQEVEDAAKASGYDFSGVTAPADDHSLYTVSYESFVVPLVKAVQEQQVIIDALKQLYEDQQHIIENLEKRISVTEQRNLKN